MSQDGLKMEIVWKWKVFRILRKLSTIVRWVFIKKYLWENQRRLSVKEISIIDRYRSFIGGLTFMSLLVLTAERTSRNFSEDLEVQQQVRLMIAYWISHVGTSSESNGLRQQSRLEMSWESIKMLPFRQTIHSRFSDAIQSQDQSFMNWHLLH